MDDDKDPSNLRNLADAHRKMGDLYRGLGQIDQAYKRLQETHDIRENIARVSPKDDLARFDDTNRREIWVTSIFMRRAMQRRRTKYKRGLIIATDLVEHPRSGEPPLIEHKRVVADLY